MFLLFILTVSCLNRWQGNGVLWVAFSTLFFAGKKLLTRMLAQRAQWASTCIQTCSATTLRVWGLSRVDTLTQTDGVSFLLRFHAITTFRQQLTLASCWWQQVKPILHELKPTFTYLHEPCLEAWAWMRSDHESSRLDYWWSVLQCWTVYQPSMKDKNAACCFLLSWHWTWLLLK